MHKMDKSTNFCLLLSLKIICLRKYIFHCLYLVKIPQIKKEEDLGPISAKTMLIFPAKRI